MPLMPFARAMLNKINDDVWIILAFSVFAWLPLLTPAYFFEAHDAKHSIFFLVEFDQTFRDGFWWPRWSPDFSFGYGYPLFNLYAPLAFYAAELLHWLLGLSFTTAIKTMYLVATVGAGLGMYGFVRRLFGQWAGLLAGTIYIYVPFHLAEIFVRSAYAEFVALALIPWLFWSFTELIAAPTLKRVAPAALTYGLLALTHHTSFFTFTPLLMVYILYLTLSKAGLRLRPFLRYSGVAIGAGSGGLALAAIYLVPLLTEMRFIKIEQWTSGSYNYLDHFVYFSQFLSPRWGYGYAGIGLLDDFSFQLGIVVIVLLGFATVALLRTPFPQHGTALFFLMATLIVIFLMSPLAEVTWQVIPIAALVQFPWRLLGVTAFTMSIVAGSLVASPAQSPTTPSLAETAPPSSKRIVPLSLNTPAPLYLLGLIVILGSFPYTLPQYTDIPDWAEKPVAVVNWDRASIVDRVGMVSATETQPQTSPMEAEYLADGRPTTVAGIIAGQGTIETIYHGGGSDTIRVVASEPSTVQFYTYDYPGWQVSRNGQPLDHRPEPPYGLITVDIPPGEQTLQLRMGSTPPRLIGITLSGLTLLLILGALLMPRHPRHQGNLEKRSSSLKGY